jgi:hypothetical protein|tara:strand:+ start:3091 stop:3315 length:225 start_codon:yes stop_codon:yes gene_type:complete
MRAYFIIVTDRLGGDDWHEYYSSIRKAQKARAVHRRNEEVDVHPTIFKTTWKPTKKGFIARLNNSDAGLPVEGA